MNGTPENHQDVLQDREGKSALYRLAELATQFDAERIAASARFVAERVSEGLFYVACVGQFKRGKSTLLNALVGHSVLPAGVVPVTAVPTIIRHGECLSARVRFQGANWTDIPVSSVREYVSEEKNPENVKGVVALEIFIPSHLLTTGMCLVDTPGLGSVFAGSTAATQAFLPHIDAAVVVIGYDPPLSGEEIQLVETVAREVHNLIFVLNKADRAKKEERSEAVAFARSVLEKRLKRTVPMIFEVSALERLEQLGPERDWGKFLQALEDLVLRSGRSLVHKAIERGLQRAADQLLAVIQKERDELLRPVEDSERRITKLREALQQADRAMRDLGVLLSAQQQRLSETLSERRNAFLKQARLRGHEELGERLRSIIRRGSGPAYRRAVMHLAQQIACARVMPWLEGEAEYAQEAYRKTAERFAELGNDFLRRLAETGIPELASLPGELEPEQTLRAQSQFSLHLIERVAAPASPFLFVVDLVLGSLGWRTGIVRDANDFLDQLLEVNCSRVQSDVDERVRESRRELEREIKGLLREASAIAERALAHARTAQAAGALAVEAALARLDRAEQELLSFRRSRQPPDPHG